MKVGIYISKKDLDIFIESLNQGFEVRSMEYIGDEDGMDGYWLELDPIQKKSVGRKCRFSDANVAVMLQMKHDGVSLREIAKQMGTDHKTVSRYIQKKNSLAK